MTLCHIMSRALSSVESVDENADSQSNRKFGKSHTHSAYPMPLPYIDFYLAIYAHFPFLDFGWLACVVPSCARLFYSFTCAPNRRCAVSRASVSFWRRFFFSSCGTMWHQRNEKKKSWQDTRSPVTWPSTNGRTNRYMKLELKMEICAKCPVNVM